MSKKRNNTTKEKIGPDKPGPEIRPQKQDDDNDYTRPRPGVNDPGKKDPTREEPGKNDPTRPTVPHKRKS